MTVDFSDYFWGEGQKITGIEVLLQNAKTGVASTREVAEFMKERSSLEESHSKAFGKLAKLASNGTPTGSFAPMWQVLKNLSEKLSSAHTQMVQKIEELVKELLKYTDELQKQYKSVKESETGTVESVQLYQNSKAMVLKTKAVYMQRYLELEKCQKDNAPQKELEKADARMKKAQEEYKGWVEKYQACTEDYVSKMTESCRRFQDVEIFYLEKIKEFMDTYSNMMDTNHESIGQVHYEFRNECSNLTVEELLQQLVRQKATGNTRPSVNPDIDDILINLEVSHSGSSEDKSSLSISGEKEKEKPAAALAPSTLAAPVIASEKLFEGNNDTTASTSSSVSMPLGDRPSKASRRTTSLLNLFIPQSQGSKNSIHTKGVNFTSALTSTEVDIENPSHSTLSRANNRGSKWFLRSRRGKKKDKVKKKDKSDESTNLEETETATASQNPSETSEANASNVDVSVNSPKVDAEGFTIRPKDVWEEDASKFYSSSDTDSDEEPEKRLHVEIKPLTNGTAPLSASVDELRTTVENLTLSSVAIASRKVVIDTDAQMKRSHSVSQQIGSTSPPPRHPYAPLSPPMPPDSKTSPNPTVNLNDSCYAELGDIFAEVGEMQPSLPPKASRSTPTSGTMSIPRPPSRPRPEIPLLPQRNANSPSPTVSRTDSVASLETKSIGSHMSGSRGPSPLTLGMSDSIPGCSIGLGGIPIAIAFHEIVHAYFKGNDENQCKVKMTGDMMVSFPAGIIQVFANNPSPAQLSFKICRAQRLENLISNKNLVKVDSLEDVLHFEFDMFALTVLLKAHAEQNPNASYFNVDILKYQIKPKPGAASCPLHLVAFWKCETNQTDLRIDYKYNGRAMEPSQSEVVGVKNSPSNSPSVPQLSQVCVAAPVDGGVKTMQSKPSGQWFSSTNRACWKLSTLSSKSENLGVGSLRARFDVSNGPSSNGTIAAQFSCENSTLSGCEFELLGSGYRVSLVKKRFVSGKYICDSEENSNRYAVPPEYSKPVHL